MRPTLPADPADVPPLRDVFRRFAVLILLAVFLAAIGGVVGGAFRLLQVPLDITSGKGPGQVVFYLLMLGGLWGFVQGVWRPERIGATWAAYRDPANRTRLWASLGIGWGTASLLMLVGFGLLLVIGGATADPDALLCMKPSAVFNTLVAALVVWVLVATEEAIFRAIVQNYLRGDGVQSRATVWAAILLSAAVFAFAHGAQWGFRWNEEGKPPLLVGLFLLGVLLALLYEASGSLLPGAGVHIALIYAKILPDRTGVVTLDQAHYWYTGVHGDPRTGAYIWAMFALLAALAWAGRRRLHDVCAIEPGKPGFEPSRR